METERSLLCGRDIPIFSDSPEDWKARQKAYPGDERDVDQGMWNQTFPRELVEKQLFRDRTLSKQLRHKLFLGLVRLSIRFDMPGPLIPHAGRLDYLEGGEFIAPQHGFPIHPENLERAKKNHQGIGEMLIPAREVRFVKQTEAILSEPKLNAHLVRWAVEVRQKQLDEARTRDIPESIRRGRDERGGEENIQFKRKYRQ